MGAAYVCQAWNYPNLEEMLASRGDLQEAVCRGGSHVEQQLGTTTLPDGTTLAYATAGDGPPLLLIGGWLSHLELSWALPAERHLFEGLARGRTVLRYYRPGCGLSDRPAPGPASIESELDNIAAVLAASDLDRYDVIGSSLGAPIAIEWAARYPTAVDHLVLYGGW